MSVDSDKVLPRLHNLDITTITDEMNQERQEFKQIPKGELVSYTADDSSV
jgi:hypothetical protein